MRELLRFPTNAALVLFQTSVEGSHSRYAVRARFKAFAPFDLAFGAKR
jgi:hypothetical protein